MTTKSAKRPIASFMLVSAGAAFTLLAADVDAQEFQYTGDDGPAHWSELNPAWEACAGAEESARQSPIDIGRADFDSRLTRLNLRTFPTTIDMFNNGHTIEQHYEETGSSISFDGVEYELQQFHFHTLSEHTVRNQHDVMKMHAQCEASTMSWRCMRFSAQADSISWWGCCSRSASTSIPSFKS